MNINSFYSQTLTERMTLLNKHGEFISRIKYYGFFVNLYVYERSLIEVYCNIHTRKIEEIELMDPKDQRLHQYAVMVNLSDLYTKKS